MENLLFNAIIEKFKAQRIEAQAMLSVLFITPNGDAMTDLTKYSLQLAEAESVLQSLEKNFGSVEITENEITEIK